MMDSHFPSPRGKKACLLVHSHFVLILVHFKQHSATMILEIADIGKCALDVAPEDIATQVASSSFSFGFLCRKPG